MFVQMNARLVEEGDQVHYFNSTYCTVNTGVSVYFT